MLLRNCFITMRCTVVQSTVLRLHVICPSVCDFGGSWPHRLKKLCIFALCSPKVSTYYQGNMEKFGEKLTSITPGWIEPSSTESHMILGGGVAAGCLFTFVVASRGHLCDCTAFFNSCMMYRCTVVWALQGTGTGICQSCTNAEGRRVRNPPCQNWCDSGNDSGWAIFCIWLPNNKAFSWLREAPIGIYSGTNGRRLCSVVEEEKWTSSHGNW